MLKKIPLSKKGIFSIKLILWPMITLYPLEVAANAKSNLENNSLFFTSMGK